ncbi:MAG: hypothetical protein OEY85_09260 [Rhodospirillales bacterium]|nr:hypothetical protein [Rhodospirillales bacterium]
MVIELFGKNRHNQRSGAGRRSGWERRTNNDRRGESRNSEDNPGLGSLSYSNPNEGYLKTKALYEQPHMDRRNGQGRRIVVDRRYTERRNTKTSASDSGNYPGEIYYFPSIDKKNPY